MLKVKSAKQYYKADYKVHISTESQCADHCSVYSLSTSEPQFCGLCKHNHNLVCDRCEDIKNACTDIQVLMALPDLQLR